MIVMLSLKAYIMPEPLIIKLIGTRFAGSIITNGSNMMNQK